MKADKLFKELKYEKSEDETAIIYKKNIDERNLYPTSIRFDKLVKDIYVSRDGSGTALTKEILEAINEKVKELNW